MVMDTIDLDPASCEFANRTVKAKEYFSLENDGLSQEWHGNVWLNPPYGRGLLSKFAKKIAESYEEGKIEQAIVLVNNGTETQWFRKLIDKSSAFVFPIGRIFFVNQYGEEKKDTLQGQCFIYFGNNPEKFLEVFKKYGWGEVRQK
jgi:hypothetical protein